MNTNLNFSIESVCKALTKIIGGKRRSLRYIMVEFLDPGDKNHITRIKTEKARTV